MVKFGFFLLLGNGLNIIGQVVPGVIVINGRLFVNPDGDVDRVLPVVYIGYTLVNAGLVPTPILIPIFFKSIWKRLLHWLCCCMAKKRKAKRKHNNNYNNNNNGDDHMVTATV